MVMTTSARAAAPLAVSSLLPPAATSLATEAGLTSTPSTACPALSRFCAIGSPMLPSPINPMRAITPSSRSKRMFLGRHQGQPQINREQPAFQQAGHHAGAKHLRENEFQRQHRSDRSQPDNRAPGGGEPD